MGKNKCVCPPGGKNGKKNGGSSSSGRGSGPGNPFILYYLDNLKRCGGNYYRVARRSGEKWRAMSQAEKDKWYSLFYSQPQHQNSRGYRRWKKRQNKGGGCC
ncbi:unnamed protein product [Orchesella dallaii]|uniref:HMG box domain-containing protein n=1 Tax=Orchesella dallaii TaxID=48710 RepID=A0ABP1R176_9HEXA